MEREAVKIRGCGYIYTKVLDWNCDIYKLYHDSDDKWWREDLKGKLATQIKDTGNGLKIRQEKKNRLDYSEAAEIQFLLNKIMK